MRKPQKSKIGIFVLSAVFLIPVIALATESGSWWTWTTEPVCDVKFDCVSVDFGRVTNLILEKGRLPKLYTTKLEPTDISACVNSQRIYFNCIQLKDCNGTSVKVYVCGADLITDALGSSFKADAKIKVCSPTGDYCVDGVVCGRITKFFGKYYLTAGLQGCEEAVINSNKKIIHTIRATLSGNTSACCSEED